MRVRVLSSAVRDAGKPRVHGYVWASRPDALRARQDLLTCWTYEQGWLLSKIFTDERPGFGPGMSALLRAIQTTDTHAVVMFSDEGAARALARRIDRSGTPCLMLPSDLDCFHYFH
ncbi:hypothetical protein [Actinocrispum wychmicini]|uniref:hypothetical protein n=1 Tax=Actinocrispum wychmicini TaxID=1213861 RepID=UPI001A9D880B|nr:hypothetical protein [Actinocrispum wychmicini]